MAGYPEDQQLELFDVSNQPTVRLRRESHGRLIFHLRHDQAILWTIGSLLGLTVIFAFGVERGKQLARTERSILSRSQVASIPSLSVTAPPKVQTQTQNQAPASQSASSLISSPANTQAAPSPKDKTNKSPAPGKLKDKERTKLASENRLSKSRYAVQVATYRQPQLARAEIERLREGGEIAFMVIREGHTAVYVGPFPSKDHASEKLVGLKSKYQGCFVKTL